MTTWAMIDLETLDTRPEAQILTIGGVKFNPFTWDEPHSPFSYRFDIDEQEQLGRTVSEDTLNNFWAKQSDEIIEAAFSPHDRTGCRDVLRDLKKWYVGCDRVWSQGEFDTVMIENMCRQLGEPIPWAFWTVENCRTILNRMPTDPRKSLNFAAHDAVEDCKAQVYALRKAFEHFGMKR
jgi:hypothetical protein